jgi:hypothetical protein
MKRITDEHLSERSPFQPAISPDVPPGAPWNEMRLPQVPAADWPASLALDYAIDRVVREVLSSGRSLQEAIARVTELAETLGPQLTQAEIRRRVHAQMIANS